jgi:predicted outer membrane lipoprotein
MMKRAVIFALLMLLALLVIFLAILLGDHGPWYFAWLLGTATIVLVAAAGGAMFDTQEEHMDARRRDDSH